MHATRAARSSGLHAVDQLASQRRFGSWEGMGTEMCAAAAEGNIEMLKQLLRGGVRVDQGDHNARTALHLAASEGRLGTVHFLVKEAHAEVNVLDCFGSTPLDDALNNNFAAVAAFLRQESAQAGEASRTGARMLCLAAAQGDVSELQEQLARGVHVNVCDHAGRTAMHVAASEGQIAALRLLVDAGAAVNPVDNRGHTPLDDAIWQKHEATATYLCELGGRTQRQSVDRPADRRAGFLPGLGRTASKGRFLSGPFRRPSPDPAAAPPSPEVQ